MDEAQIRALSDEDFAALQQCVLAEQARRFTLRQIPADITELAAQYREAGGDEQALTEALTPAQSAPDGAAADHFDYLPEEG